MNTIIRDLDNEKLQALVKFMAEDETLNREICCDACEYVAMTEEQYLTLLPESITGDHEQDFSQFGTKRGTLYPELYYVAINRDGKMRRNDKVFSFGYKKLEASVFFEWYDYFGADCMVGEIPMAVVEEEI